MSIKAMKQALKVLDSVGSFSPDVWAEIDSAKEALRAAIEQAEQGQWDAIPDAFNEWWNADYDDTGNPYRKDSPAYWAWAGWSAANKEWVGLTEIEICDIEADELTSASSETFSFARAIEAKLKEKNR